MAKKIVKLGMVCLTRNTFDYKAAEEIYRGIISELEKREDISI